MTALDTDLLAELVGQKLDALEQLRALGHQQLELIAADQLSELLALLASKQHWLERLQEIERRLDPFRGQSPDERQWRDPSHRHNCAATLATCEQLLAEIVETERESEQQMCRRRDELAGQLQGAHWASSARGAYLAENASRPSQFDIATGG